MCACFMLTIYGGASVVLTVRIAKIATPACNPPSFGALFKSPDHSEVIQAACPQAIR